MGEVVKFPPPQPDQNYVSPYLLRPLRRKEEVEGVQPSPGDEKIVEPAEEKRPAGREPAGAAD